MMLKKNVILIISFFWWPFFSNLKGEETSTTVFPNFIEFTIDIFQVKLKDLNNFATP
jgi:hypothetical protein